MFDSSSDEADDQSLYFQRLTGFGALIPGNDPLLHSSLRQVGEPLSQGMLQLPSPSNTEFSSHCTRASQANATHSHRVDGLDGWMVAFCIW